MRHLVTQAPTGFQLDELVGDFVETAVDSGRRSVLARQFEALIADEQVQASDAIGVGCALETSKSESGGSAIPAGLALNPDHRVATLQVAKALDQNCPFGEGCGYNSFSSSRTTAIWSFLRARSK